MAVNGKPMVIFVHGILGFNVLGLPKLGLAIRYFRGLHKSLKNLPVEAHFPTLPPVGRIADRAQALADYIEELGVDSVHLIGHSMGGLDCRYFTTHLDPKRRVRSVTTVATPHHGTPLSDWIVTGRGLFPKLAGWVLGSGIEDLTTDALERFNTEVPDREDVEYNSYAGARPIDEMPPWYRPWTRLIANRKGDNDSQVPVESARWGQFIRELRADHLELVGWSLALPSRTRQRPFDHIGLYHEIVKRLIYS